MHSCTCMRVGYVFHHAYMYVCTHAKESVVSHSSPSGLAVSSSNQQCTVSVVTIVELTREAGQAEILNHKIICPDGNLNPHSSRYTRGAKKRARTIRRC